MFDAANMLSRDTKETATGACQQENEKNDQKQQGEQPGKPIATLLNHYRMRRSPTNPTGFRRISSLFAIGTESRLRIVA